MPDSAQALVIPDAGIEFILTCGCTGIHLPDNKMRAPMLNGHRMCAKHLTIARITQVWSNL